MSPNVFMFYWNYVTYYTLSILMSFADSGIQTSERSTITYKSCLLRKAKKFNFLKFQDLLGTYRRKFPSELCSRNSRNLSFKSQVALLPSVTIFEKMAALAISQVEKFLLWRPMLQMAFEPVTTGTPKHRGAPKPPLDPDPIYSKISKKNRIDIFCDIGWKTNWDGKRNPPRIIFFIFGGKWKWAIFFVIFIAAVKMRRLPILLFPEELALLILFQGQI